MAFVSLRAALTGWRERDARHLHDSHTHTHARTHAHTHTQGSGKVEQWPKRTHCQVHREGLWLRSIELGVVSMWRSVCVCVFRVCGQWWTRVVQVVTGQMTVIILQQWERKNNKPPTDLLQSLMTTTLHELCSNSHEDDSVCSLPSAVCLLSGTSVCAGCPTQRRGCRSAVVSRSLFLLPRVTCHEWHSVKRTLPDSHLCWNITECPEVTWPELHWHPQMVRSKILLPNLGGKGNKVKKKGGELLTKHHYP